jgi:rhodanese-related sulfurtransferase/DNA-binding transcriptional ArsR family regulator
MSMRGPKQEAFALLARVGSALASEVRLEILELLAQSERGVDELASMTGASVANTSQHLQRLRQAGLVTGRKSGQAVVYRLTGERVATLLTVLAEVGVAHNAEIDRIVQAYYRSKDGFEAVAAPDLLVRARKGLVTVLDVRPAEEFDAGHVPGAVNIPVDELAKRLRELPRGKEIIAYCRGAFCLMSFEAVEMLRRKGFKARRLQDGMPEWRTAGLPVELSAS